MTFNVHHKNKHEKEQGGKGKYKLIYTLYMKLRTVSKNRLHKFYTAAVYLKIDLATMTSHRNLWYREMFWVYMKDTHRVRWSTLIVPC